MPKSSTPSHFGHRRRMKQRLLSNGIDSFLDHEILELLLTYAIARKDTKPLAWELIKRFGSLSEVLDAGEMSLMEVEGIGPHTAQFLTLIRGIIKRYLYAGLPKQISMGNPEEVLNYCQASLADKQEEFLEVLLLSVRYTLKSARIIASGTLDKILIEPKQILRWALKENAAAIILVHNHPSGNPSPSPQDIQMTKQIVDAANLLNIQVLDHLIVSKGTYYSFLAHGYIKEQKKLPPNY